MSDSSDAAAAAAAAAKAMAAALAQFNTELWTLWAIGVCLTALRTYARIAATSRVSGISGSLRPDDILVWVAILVYTTQSTLAFWVVNHVNGLANNSMTDEERAGLDVTSIEYADRVLGSKIQVVGWTMYIILIYFLRLCMLFFYNRLTEGLTRYRIRIQVGFGVITVVFIASFLTVYLECRPFYKNWQVNPDPGNACQPAIAFPLVWITFASSVISDLYLIMIPLPMLWSTTLKPVKKIASSIVLGAGVFVLVCSLLKTIFVVTDPVHGASQAGSWGTREAFVSVTITNLPMIFPLIRKWLRPLFGSAVGGSYGDQKYNYNNKSTGFRTIGGGQVGGSQVNKTVGSSRNRASSPSHSFAESEERMIDGIKMGTFRPYTTPAVTANDSTNNSATNVAPGNVRLQNPKGIVVSNEFSVTEDARSLRG
ncbi:hypothetical protein F503_01572 [Ophiostoma piceae UAMH 11346]|uniref:Rhodopsin domain-containing protein n=1 Tax=Ophiostoma piceae (strain UAMH 11346) TaxID=1262450 RepID=S3BTU1_OPHP1|nr:hypothetical protein F503_01572 [Ophiostoma piceae UAMH 11346]